MFSSCLHEFLAGTTASSCGLETCELGQDNYCHTLVQNQYFAVFQGLYLFLHKYNFLHAGDPTHKTHIAFYGSDNLNPPAMMSPSFYYPCRAVNLQFSAFTHLFAPCQGCQQQILRTTQPLDRSIFCCVLMTVRSRTSACDLPF